ncbi:MAG: signal peptidase I [Planctomycetota bacterium]|jgi:signal peptidase I
MSASSSRKKETGSKSSVRKDRVAEVANTFEWLITAFILAFMFRAFVMEAFRIPTGSMADTLKGAHFRLRCLQCGYRYDYGFIPEKYGYPQDYIPRANLKSYDSRCPSCGHYQQTGGTSLVANGDRILVLKCIYQFFEPKRWDVVVFKNPLDPAINYIKRLIGRPGESLEIIDGDIYINGQIARKPDKVQDELWMPVYDNDYQPADPQASRFNRHRWRQPFRNLENSAWEIDKSNPAQFLLNSTPEQINTLIYDTLIGNDFRATYAYDDVREYRYMPFCSDLMVRLYARAGGPQARAGISLSKYESEYRAWVEFTGRMVIAEILDGRESILNTKAIAPPNAAKPVLVQFANVDHQLIFQLGKEKLTWDLGRDPNDAGPRKTNISPRVRILGSGKLTVSHMAISRDIHYTAAKFANSGRTGLATEGHPLKLETDEFFMLGDNSPNSEDSRWWSSRGKGNNNVTYRKGIVPRGHLVGKAMFVYWPSGFKPYRQFPFGVVPNVGAMRFIYGGSGQE